MVSKRRQEKSKPESNYTVVLKNLPSNFDVRRGNDGSKEKQGKDNHRIQCNDRSSLGQINEEMEFNVLLLPQPCNAGILYSLNFF